MKKQLKKVEQSIFKSISDKGLVSKVYKELLSLKMKVAKKHVQESSRSLSTRGMEIKIK